MTGKVCHGGSSQYSKENRASCHWGNQRELCDRNTEYSAACWYEDYRLLKVAEKIKWKSKGPLTSGRGVRMSVCNWRVCVCVCCGPQTRERYRKSLCCLEMTFRQRSWFWRKSRCSRSALIALSLSLSPSFLVLFCYVCLLCLNWL